jgi:hypothetical protein
MPELCQEHLPVKLFAEQFRASGQWYAFSNLQPHSFCWQNIFFPGDLLPYSHCPNMNEVTFNSLRK